MQVLFIKHILTYNNGNNSACLRYRLVVSYLIITAWITAWKSEGCTYADFKLGYHIGILCP